MDNGTRKQSYTIPCSSSFRDAVNALAARRRVNVADLARSVLLVLPEDAIETLADPGGPARHDRETVILKSGPAEGRPWRRKPRLQVRMAPGYAIPLMRKALALALAVGRGETTVRPDGNGADGEIREELERLRAIVSVLSCELLPGGIRTRDEALYILGFPPQSMPGMRALKARFRMLATIHHPDALYGNTERMSQLNAAMQMLRNHGT